MLGLSNGPNSVSEDRNKSNIRNIVFRIPDDGIISSDYGRYAPSSGLFRIYRDDRMELLLFFGLPFLLAAARQNWPVPIDVIIRTAGVKAGISYVLRINCDRARMIENRQYNLLSQAALTH
jgi:hypothetical protein